MTRDVLVRYLIDGLPVGKIADDLNIDRSSVRMWLRDGGIAVRPVRGSYLLGRDVVCAAVKRIGYPSFHAFARVKGLDPITEQASSLDVSEKSLSRVYSSYRRLLVSLKSAGIVLPTPQLDGAGLEQPRRTEERAP